ncbi:MAG: hypothetical protein DRI32_07825 [Chloroflexi bacterium]|nr:MAG: hypothetical protein DRI32_07825 [Chloroflexota bacterium]
MPEYEKYSRNIWDYIEELSYMPSRKDREKLFRDKSKRERMKFWDYFFRIKPKDVGKPQRKEFLKIKKKIQADAKKCKKQKEEILENIHNLKEKALKKAKKRLLIGNIIIVFFILLFDYLFFITRLSVRDRIFYIGVFFLVSWGILFVLTSSIGYLRGYEIKKTKKLSHTLEDIKKVHDKNSKEAKKRIKALRKEIARLKREAPYVLKSQKFHPLSGPEVDKEIWDEVGKLKEQAREDVSLNRELILDSGITENPIVVIGPGELQYKIPEPFILPPPGNQDLPKHLSAKQAYKQDEEKFGIVYSVYFMQFIFIGKNMLITYSLFYDFIDDIVRAKHIREQYYKDVVGLQIINEYRKLVAYRDAASSITVEDAPTFILSLSSGEKHRITFVNEDYFMQIRKEINLSEKNVGKISWVSESTRDANNAIFALRKYLRKHKVENK